ncbi:mannose-P-dolichol utilization defect 1 protein homolog 2-like isoform X1 [Lycium ferocissimum]|uniref:mannose-P-dolichol utilization defect 1 protein homolog 2-like isoform X1 n=1 Tax=Lycium ferocissimum TaxID=112874 RepID=UPI002815B916|nr:mannose-P-dolichol utilization defect 1 protein homolog 2-like isoform X1 [Lycium ferocissimum]
MVELKFLGMNFGCVVAALSKGEFPEKDCLLPLISKLLGYAIVAASTTVKLPQILKILRHKSVRGLSVVSFELEVIGYTIALAYCLHKGLPFSAFGEYAFLLIQAVILVAIIYYFSQPLGTKTWIRGLLYCAIAPIVLAGQIDPILFEALYASQHSIFLFARIPQIWKNFQNRSTGELSFLTFFMNFGGSMGKFTIELLVALPKMKFSPTFPFYVAVRVFTSLQEKAPMSVVMGSVIGVVMNGTILSQILLSQAPAPKKGKKTN